MLNIAKLGLVLSLLASPLLAQSVERSPRPQSNPKITGMVAPLALVPAVALAGGGIARPSAEAAALVPSLRPKPRPADLPGQIAALRSASQPVAAQGLDLIGLRPKPRPAGLVVEMAALQAAPEASNSAATATSFSKKSAPEANGKRQKRQKTEAPAVSGRGSVCGVPAIKGEAIAPITSRVQGCGLADGVRVTSISGVRLSMAVTIDCDTAKALNRWVETALQPAYDGQVVQLRIAGHYICRPRNNKKGAKVSEHGRGKAIDIAGIVLANGRTNMVLGGFDARMRQAHRGACGLFGTTLGPGSDGYHEDHMHFDTARNRSPYCR